MREVIQDVLAIVREVIQDVLAIVGLLILVLWGIDYFVVDVFPYLNRFLYLLDNLVKGVL